METKTNVPLHKKHFRAFWPLTILVVVAAVAAGMILWATFNGSLDDDLSSMSFDVHVTKKSIGHTAPQPGSSTNNTTPVTQK